MSGDHATISGAAARYASALFELANEARLAVAADNGRAGELSGMAAAYAALAAEARGVSSAQVTSATKLSDKDIDALKASLKRALGCDVDVQANEDPDILGGLIVQVGSRMYDSSLRTKLEGLRTAMKEA